MKAATTEREQKSQQKQQQQESKSSNGAENSFVNESNSVQMKKNPFLPADVQGKMESTMGADFSDVKIQTNSQKASDMGAHAFAQGNEVHFAQGKFDPNSKTGQSLIGHELAHVKQQREGRVKADTMLGKTPVNTSNALESEADVLGAKAADAKAGAPVTQNKMASGSINTSQAPVQGFFGSLVSKGLSFLKSKVADMIPEEYKNMIPQGIRDMASGLADKGIEAASGLADKAGSSLMEKAKSKLAESVPPHLMALVDRVPPELRTYIEGQLQSAGKLAAGSLGEGRLPTGAEMKALGKGAASGGVDVAKQLIPKAIPADVKGMLDKLPPEVKDLASKQFDGGMDMLKGGIESGEMPDVKTFAKETVTKGAGVGIDLVSEKVMSKMPGPVQSALEGLPAEAKSFLMNKLASTI
ncbi:MAG: DUF4157 domain-containing protein [Bacteroidetes bacterium]|nr:MAG: DUF4157 domain-containing protein [Bacteroidota bacterium]TAG88274.1 MAG: DUF4157 domain-containing protein [Bacteroidota bacterium]